MMQNTTETHLVQPIEMIDILRGIWARKMMLLALAAIFGLGAVAYVMNTPPSYTSDAQVLIDNLDTPYDRTQSTDTQGRVVIDDRDVLSQVSVISSRDLAYRVIKTLGLAGTPEFDPLKSRPGMVGRIALMLGFREDPARKTPEQRAYDRYVDRLNVFQIPLSKIIVIKYTSTNPKTAADVANTLGELYVTSTRESQSESMNRARDWLALQIEDLRRKVAASEAAVEEFRAGANLLKGTQTTLGTQELSELSTQITLAEAARSEAQAKAQNIRELIANGGNIDASPDVLGSATVQHLRQQQIALNRSLTELSVTYLPGHPKVIAARNELAGIDRQIRNEAMRVVAGLEDQARIASSREAAMRASLNAAKAKASASNQDEVKLRALERNANADRALLETLLNRYADASARQDLGTQPAMARIIQRAAVPSTPSFPLPGPTVLLGTLAGLTLGLGLAFLASVLSAARGSDRATAAAVIPVAVSKADAVQATAPDAAAFPRESRLGLQMPPALSADRLQKVINPRPTGERPELPLGAALGLGSASETFTKGVETLTSGSQPSLEVPASNDIGTAVANAQQAVGPEGDYAHAVERVVKWTQTARQTLGVHRLAVGGLKLPGPDTAALSTAIARSMSRQGYRVVAIDCDPLSAAMQTVFGAESGSGLSELLGGKASFEHVIARDRVSTAHFMRGGENREALLSLASEKRMDAVFEALSEVYDAVIVNCGELNQDRALIMKCQGAILVADSTYASEIADVAEGLKNNGMRAVQIVRTAKTPMSSVAAA